MVSDLVSRRRDGGMAGWRDGGMAGWRDGMVNH